MKMLLSKNELRIFLNFKINLMKGMIIITKKGLSIISLSLSFILILSIVFNIYLFNTTKIKAEETIKLKGEISNIYDYLNSITIKNFEEQVLNKKELIVYIGRPDCSDCNFFEQAFENAIKEYNLYDKIQYLNVKKYRESNKENWENFKEIYRFHQTPALIHFKDGENISIVEWDDEKGLSDSILLEWLKNNNLIN